MPKPNERWKSRKYTRTPGGKTVMRTFKSKPGKHSCALCREQLHGVPHGKKNYQVSRLSKTQKRPEAVYGGVLCNRCRNIVVEEAALVKGGFKKTSETDLKIRCYVEGVIARME